MPRRYVPFETGETYHVFNRSLHGIEIFGDDYWCREAKQRVWFYRFGDVRLKYSRFRKLTPLPKIFTYNTIVDSSPSVKIHAYTLMPNHFHFLITQNKDGGITWLMSNFQSSFAEFFNAKQGYTGSLFESQFQGIHVDSDEVFLHVSRYIHLNQFTAGIVKSFPELVKYEWNSLKVYSTNKPLAKPYEFVETDQVLSHFGSRADYLTFVQNQADYQKQLAHIKKHLFD